MSFGLDVLPILPGRSATAELAAMTDEELLARFFQRKEDAAFVALVERHGPLVYRVCRRVLRDTNDADDAFQATFMVLVRKGATLKQPGRLAAWLYGVANRTARKIKVRAAVRSRFEREGRQMPNKSDVPSKSKVDDLTLNEVRTIVDEEIGKLPEKYALPLTLCYLEGQTNAEAAKQLGCPEGSISRRLSRARELLKSRLLRRGLTLSAVLAAAAFAKPVLAAPPPDLVASTVSAGSLALRGVPLEEILSGQAAAVVQDVVTGFVFPTKLVASALFALSSIVLVVVVAGWQLESPDGGPPFPLSLFQESPASQSETYVPVGHCAPRPPGFESFPKPANPSPAP
jgi:RNA polymerase sigma factor (sigma-70 family)